MPSVGHRGRHGQVPPAGSQPTAGRRGPGARRRDGETTVIQRAERSAEGPADAVKSGATLRTATQPTARRPATHPAVTAHAVGARRGRRRHTRQPTAEDVVPAASASIRTRSAVATPGRHAPGPAGDGGGPLFGLQYRQHLRCRRKRQCNGSIRYSRATRRRHHCCLVQHGGVADGRSQPPRDRV